jgi:hypothetical protein
VINPEVRIPATLLYELIEATRCTGFACVGGLSIEPGQESRMGFHFAGLADEAMRILRARHPVWLAQLHGGEQPDDDLEEPA